MLVLKDINQYSAAKPLFLALGNFDGVHVGHQKILKQALEDARKHGGAAAVMTFSEHPQKVLGHEGGPHLLYSAEQKLFVLEQSGIDLCFLLSFTESFSKIEADAFVSDILVKCLNIKKVYMGHDSRFGHDRKGNSELMQKLAGKYGFEFEPAAPVEVDGEPVSSSRVRKLVEAGDFQKASELLGRPFSMFLKVIHGDARGTGLGFPTANFDIDGRVAPPMGVYPVALRPVDSTTWYQAAANCGHRPTFHPGSKKVVLEAFILDFPGQDLYGRVLEVLFYPRLRAEKTFGDIESLKAQIREDVEAVRGVLNKALQA